MDVGLNNTNTLHLALGNDYFKDIEWLVEATSEERYQLWKDWREHDENTLTVDWGEVGLGQTYTILEVEVCAKRHKAIRKTLNLTKKPYLFV